MTQFSYMPDWRWLAAGCALAAVMIVASYAFSKGRADWWVRGLCISLRIGALGMLVVCLLDPQWVEKLAQKHRARLALLFDLSKSMSTSDVGKARLDAGKDWAKRNIYDEKPAQLDVVTLGFSQNLQSLSNFSATSATGTVSAIGDSLEALLSVPTPDPLTGVVLISDGGETTTTSPEAVARLYKRRGIPIYTVVAGTTNEMKDIVLDNVQVKRAVPNEAPTRVAFALRSAGFKGRNVTVQIRRGQEVLTTKQVVLNGATQPVEVEFTPRQKGFQVYEVAVLPQAGEWLTANNRRLFGLEVIDPTVHVLYMEGTPQQGGSPKPEWKYLKDALQSDPNIKVKVLYRQFGNNGQFLNTIDTDTETGERAYPVEHPTKGFPKTMSELMDYDVVIHSDIRRDSFSPDQLENIARLVEQNGGGFVMIGGNSAFGRGGYHRTVLDRIIPLAMEGAYDNEAHAVQMEVSPTAWRHPIINFGVDMADTRRIWTEKFPYLYGFNRVERAKPGATILAEAAGEPGVILMAVQEIGKGRSMAFTSDTTRSWGRDFETIWGEPRNPAYGLSEFNNDSRYYRNFWVNAVRWLAAGKAGKTNQPVVLELSQGYAAPKDNLTASVRVRDDALRDVPNADVSLFLSTRGQTNLLAKARYDARTRSYVANWPAQEAGSYVIRAVATQQGNQLGDDRQLLVTESQDREMGDLRARPELMKAIAKSSGGQSFALDEKKGASLDPLFAGVPPDTIEFKRKPLWDKPWWLAAILGLLGAEWTLRRWKGMA
ncbi:MAG TPA: glutamine amidotransferase [Candidatus Limnocylindria bacterium]|nr:glutamine amidotransferase [Candidatus Limnocylindria bacterium]